MIKNIQDTWDYVILFLTSFCLMTYEILVSRMLAPSIGSSSLVWSGIIGFVMLGMTIGYYFGGKILHRKVLINNIIMAICVFLIFTFFYQDIFSYIRENIENTRLLIVVLTSIAVGPISYLIATLSPFLVSEIVSYGDTTNISISRAYMVGSVGAILGTFSSTFFLIPYLPIPYILLGMAFVFIILLIPYRKYLTLVIVLVLISLIGGIFLLGGNTENVFTTESLYNSIEVKDEMRSSGVMVRRLYLDKTIQSEMYLENPVALASFYAQYYDIPFAYLENPKNFLMIGGGAFSYPKYFSANYPRLQMDVVEIDPKVTQTAKDYFLFVETNNITVYSQDARVYMNNLNKEYDAILMDAFNGYSTPAHLATREYAQLIYNNLSDDGVLVINIPASLSGDYNDFLLSQYKMYQEIFPYVDLYTVLFNNKPNDLQNIMLVARKKDIVANREIFEIFQEHRVKETLETGDVVVLTDTYNPTDFLNRKFDSYFDY